MTSNVLAIHAGHDANISVYKAGSISSYVNSERITGVRHQGGLFNEHVGLALRESNLAIDEIHYVALSSTQGRELLSCDSNHVLSAFLPNGLNLSVDQYYESRSINSGLANTAYVRDTFLRGDRSHPHFWQFPQSLKEYGANGLVALSKSIVCHYTYEHPTFQEKFPFIFNPNAVEHLLHRCLLPIKFAIQGRVIPGFFVSHHLAHCFSAAFKANFHPSQPTMIITADGGGGNYEGNMVSILDSNRVLPLFSTIFTGGHFYESCGQYIGLSPGKLMGLSGHGLPDLKLAKSTYMYIQACEQRNLPDYFINAFIQKHGDPAGLPIAINSEVNRLCSLFAATVQKVLELWWLSHIADCRMRSERIIKKSISNVALGGGVSLNCPANAFAARYIDDVNFFIDPSCNDEGLSTGSGHALLQALDKTRLSRPLDLYPSNSNEQFNPFCGQYVPDEEALADELVDTCYSYCEFDDSDESWKLIANRLSQRQVGFLMRGRYEIGPRALGNRSIVAAAQFRENHFRVNAIKQREQWRPLAPAVLNEDFSKFFQGERNSYMLVTNTVVDPEILPAIVHADGSARVQCVYPMHRNFHALLHALRTLDAATLPVILNTSLNGKNQPMINSCKDLVRLMKSSSPDFAITDHFLIYKAS